MQSNLSERNQKRQNRKVPVSWIDRWTSYLTFPPQNWQCAPCQPSRHTQMPFSQTPLTQVSGSQPASNVGDDEEVEAAALTWTTQQTSATHSRNGAHGTVAIALPPPLPLPLLPWPHRQRHRHCRSQFCSRLWSNHAPPPSSSSTSRRRFRRYLDLYRNKNICTISAILIGFHVRDNGRRRRADEGRTYGTTMKTKELKRELRPALLSFGSSRLLVLARPDSALGSIRLDSTRLAQRRSRATATRYATARARRTSRTLLAAGLWWLRSAGIHTHTHTHARAHTRTHGHTHTARARTYTHTCQCCQSANLCNATQEGARGMHDHRRATL